VCLRFPVVDVTAMTSPGGQISPPRPGARHKNGGWQTLTARQLEWSRQYDEDEEENVWAAGYLRTRPHTSA